MRRGPTRSFEVVASAAALHACREGRRRHGFTLIELLVVVGIIVMAAGVMAPAIADYFRNRVIDGARGEFGTAFGQARLQAVMEGRDISVVFFREGVRIYDEVNRVFKDPDWSPDSGTFGQDERLWYRLGCARGVVSVDSRYRDPKHEPETPAVPPFEWFERRQEELREEVSERGGRMGERQYDINGLAKVTFGRDGTVRFGLGMADVPTAEFNREPCELADIVIYQRENPSACFIDLRPTGQSRSKFGDLEELPQPNPKQGSESSKDR